MKLEVGKVYTFAGRGELLVEELPNPPKKTTITVLGHGNLRAWMGVEEVLREATPEAIQLRHEQAKARIVECRDASCWCRRFDEQPTENP
jgi:hypothetical protein